MTAPAHPRRAGAVTLRDFRRRGRTTTPTTRPARAALYVRVSTEEQAREGVSLDAQEARLRAYAVAQGFADVELYRDEGVSASKPLGDRPQGAAMLAAIAAGDIQHVLAYKLDRLFRQTIDCLETARSWDRAGVAMHLVDLGGQAVNTGSAIGKFFLGMLAGVAELERNLIAERTSAALRHKVSKGERVGAPPFGYAAVGDGTAWVPVGAEQAVLERIRRQRARRATYAAIAARLNREAVPTKRGGAWHAGTVRQVVARFIGQPACGASRE